MLDYLVPRAAQDQQQRGFLPRVSRAIVLTVSTSADFEAAQARVTTLKPTPSPEELLELYALFKQGTQGDVTGSRPGLLDFKARAKFDAWEKRKGLARDAAEKA